LKSEIVSAQIAASTPPTCAARPGPTAGIGENSPIVRARIAERLTWLGAVFDPAANADGKALISRPESRLALLVVPTDEELMIAQHTLALLPKEASRKIAGERVTE
jgi:acetate kinase